MFRSGGKVVECEGKGRDGGLFGSKRGSFFFLNSSVVEK